MTRRGGRYSSGQTIGTSVSTRACSCLTLPAGIEGSPFSRRLSVSAFSLPVTTQRMRRERLMTGKVSVIRRQGGLLEKAFAQMGKVPIGVALGGYSLVHLHDMYLLPGNILAGQGAQH